MKKTMAMAALLAAMVAGAEEKKPEVTVELKGEVVDMHCYTTRGEKGEAHAGCANACISRNVPAGFLTDQGVLYLLLEERPTAVKDKVAGKAGRPAVAKGVIVERDGIKALKLVSVE